MNFLMLWKGEKPNSRMDYIKSVIDKVTEQDTITIIADNRFIRNKNIQWRSIKEVETRLVKEYPYFASIVNNVGYARWSDILRMYLMGLTADTLYLDTDVELYKRPEFEDKVNPYFIKFNHRYYDLSMMYNGNNTKFFKDYFDLLYPIIQRRSNRLNEYGFVFEYLNRWISKNTVNEIDNSIYKHYELRGK